MAAIRPLQETAPGGFSTAMAYDPLSSTAPGARPPQVLIVEDDPVTRMIDAHLIARLGCVAHGAATAREALEQLQRHTFDLILLDSHLPDMHGAEIARAVRADVRTAAVPIIAVSSDDSAPNILLLREAGVDEIAVKPLAPDQLRNLVHRWLR